ncbi:MAG: hypothetical protein H7145_07050 [Akkermansiaceae bacterium]|nr:hypothetical protein [Armatimonadota bacterium]
MDEKRKRAMTTGVIVGAVAVGLLVLAKRTPREKWRETMVRVIRDGMRLARMRYGIVAGPLFDVAERILERIEENFSANDVPKIA